MVFFSIVSYLSKQSLSLCYYLAEVDDERRCALAVIAVTVSHTSHSQVINKYLLHRLKKMADTSFHTCQMYQ